MKTIIISNRLLTDTEYPDIDIFNWNDSNRPSVENYPNVILDLFFGTPDDDGYVHLKTSNEHFYELGYEVLRCLAAGGVVLATLSPIAVNSRELGANSNEDNTVRGRKDSLSTYPEKYKGQNETSYDWLDVGFLQYTKIDALNKTHSQHLKPITKWKEVNEYFKLVKYFWTTISTDYIQDSDSVVTFTYRIEEGERWGSYVSQHKAWLLAVAEHTRGNVAIATNYAHRQGMLVLVPPFDVKDESQIYSVVKTILNLIDSIRENLIKTEEETVPEWAIQYRSAHAQELDSRIQSLQSEITALQDELLGCDEMLYLLCKKSDLLEKQVEKLFTKPSEGIVAKPTEKGSSFDLFVENSSGKTLAIEITGTKGKLNKSDPHWADFLEYLPEHTEKNQPDRLERIVLIVNTQMETPIEKRLSDGDITPPVINITKDNHICVIRSCDLYSLWLRGDSIQDIFQLLFDSEGVVSIQ